MDTLSLICAASPHLLIQSAMDTRFATPVAAHLLNWPLRGAGEAGAKSGREVDTNSKEQTGATFVP